MRGDRTVNGQHRAAGGRGDRPHLLLVGGKDSAFRSISDLDVRVTLLQERTDLTALQAERADGLVVLPELGPQLVADLGTALHRADPFDAVISFFEKQLLPTA